jgi:hypothetical protein
VLRGSLTSTQPQVVLQKGSTSHTTLRSGSAMAQFYTNHLYDGWYDTRFSMPVMVQQPCYYYTPPYMRLPHSAWVNPPRFPSNPPLIIQPSPRMTSTPPPSTSISAPALVKGPVITVKGPPLVKGLAPPVQPRLRSIVKSLRTNAATQKKSVRFTPLTASPLPAAPGTYKYTRKPHPPRAMHPARNHPCLRDNIAQRRAQTASQRPPPAHQQLSRQTSIALTSGSPGPIHFSRPPTPPPPAFFERNKTVQTGPQRPAQTQPQRPTDAPRTPITTTPGSPNRRPTPRPGALLAQVKGQPPSHRTGASGRLRRAVPPSPQRPNTSAGRSQHHQALAHRPLPRNIHYTRSTSIDINTDMQAARLASKMERMKLEADKEARVCLRKSLQALAGEYDRKNAWRLVVMN